MADHRAALAGHLGFIARRVATLQAQSADQLEAEVINNSPVGETGDFRDAWKRDGLRGTNSDPAGPFLERGSSDQAPAGVMRPAAIAVAERYR
jgi:hypothetical protein